ncbi:MAG: hypothetical protein AB1733_01650 [Thermodesulfobacteriota bacterium]
MEERNDKGNKYVLVLLERHCRPTECILDRTLSPEEAGEFLGRDSRTVARLRAAGAIRYLKLADGSYRYYLPHLIEDLTVREPHKVEESKPEPLKEPAESVQGKSPTSASKVTKDKIKKDLKDL